MGKMNELSQVVARVNEVTEGFFRCSEAEQEARRTEYRTVLQPALLAAYGEDAPGHMVDPWMADTYSDLYKDRYGCRPREYSYRTMKSFMDNIPPLEDFLDEEDEMDGIERAQLEAAFPSLTGGEQDDEDEGDRFDPDITKWVSDEDEVAAAARDFEEVYGVSAMGQALKFHGMVEGY